MCGVVSLRRAAQLAVGIEQRGVGAACTGAVIVLLRVVHVALPPGADEITVNQNHAARRPFPLQISNCRSDSVFACRAAVVCHSSTRISRDNRPGDAIDRCCRWPRNRAPLAHARRKGRCCRKQNDCRGDRPIRFAFMSFSFGGNCELLRHRRVYAIRPRPGKTTTRATAQSASATGPICASDLDSSRCAAHVLRGRISMTSASRGKNSACGAGLPARSESTNSLPVDRARANTRPDGLRHSLFRLLEKRVH